MINFMIAKIITWMDLGFEEHLLFCGVVFGVGKSRGNKVAAILF